MKLTATVAVAAIFAAALAAAEPDRNEATRVSAEQNAAVLSALPFENVEDFDLARRGLIARPESTEIRNAAGDVVWSLDPFAFIDGDAPASVNPSLWRQARLNLEYGLFKVTDGIYQVRGYDISNLSIIESDSGYIVVDPLITREVAAAAMALVYEHLGEKPVVAVIYSHSHADHFGGVKGVVTQADVDAGRTSIIASQGFSKFAVSENVLAGNAMTRRVTYMFGTLLPRDELGSVGVGLGQGVSAGEITIIAPTDIITQTPEERVIDGVRFTFMNTPFAEAPAELMFYLPDLKAFYAAEEANATLHNVYTLRGAEVRDTRLWSRYLDDAIGLIDADAKVLFGGHHWPRWGYDDIVEYLSKQRDLYKYIHDQTLRLANHGHTMAEISNLLELPDSLGQYWYNRGYYGTLSHNSRAVYQKYLGYFNGNPATLDPLPPADSARRYVDLAGGADALLANARDAYAAGDYRWVVEVVNHLVFAEPDNAAARELQADALEQLGYVAESGQWRNFYLTAAKELRDGVDRGVTTRTLSADMLASLPLEDLFDYLAVRLNGPDADGLSLSIGLDFTDSEMNYVLTVNNSVLRYRPVVTTDSADVRIRLTREGFLALTMAGISVTALQATRIIEVSGEAEALTQFLNLLDRFEFWFNIVTP